MTQMAKVLQELEKGPATSADIADSINIQQSSVTSYLKTLRDMGLINIVGNAPIGNGRTIRIYQAVYQQNLNLLKNQPYNRYILCDG